MESGYTRPLRHIGSGYRRQALSGQGVQIHTTIFFLRRGLKQGGRGTEAGALKQGGRGTEGGALKQGGGGGTEGGALKQGGGY